MVELREARKIASSSGLGLQYVLKEARVLDIWGKAEPSHHVGKGQVKSNHCVKGRDCAQQDIPAKSAEVLRGLGL
jgi:hypothetical protein